DADQARRSPVDLVLDLGPEDLHAVEGELGAVIEEPVEIEEPLVDDVLVQRALVLDDHRAVVLVDPQGVDPAGVGLAGRVLGGEEPDARNDSRCCSMRFWRLFSSATELPASSFTDPLPMRNSFMSLIQPSLPRHHAASARRRTSATTSRRRSTSVDSNSASGPSGLTSVNGDS